ncbi:MAG: NADH-quinone oxidoreductase subunit NuoK [Dehalococcoidia bacterium]
MVTLEHYLLLSLALFSIGLLGSLYRRNVVIILMSIELMLNGINLSLVAFSRYLIPGEMVGHIFVLFIFTIAAVEIAIALAILIVIFYRKNSINSSDLNLLKW